jgi:hypothetical protein
MQEAEPIEIKASSRFDLDGLGEEDGEPGCGAAHLRTSRLSVVLAPEGWTDAAL